MPFLVFASPARPLQLAMQHDCLQSVETALKSLGLREVV